MKILPGRRPLRTSSLGPRSATPSRIHRTLPRARRGVITIYVAIFGLVLVGFLALGIDAAYTVHTLQELHVAADASALAAAARVKTDTPGSGFAATRQAAVDTALLNDAANAGVQLDPNPANAATGDVVVGWWDPVTKQFHEYDPLVGLHDAVRVRARRTSSSLGGKLSLFFGGIFGTPDVDVSRSSTAQVAPPLDPYILVLRPTQSGSLYMNGNPSLSVPNGAVQVDSNAPQGLDGVGNPSITAKRIRVCGPTVTSAGNFTPTPRVNSPYLPDPLASLPSPTIPPSYLPPITGTGTYPPGYYSHISLTGQAIATLQPGIFVIAKGSGHKNKGIELKGGSQLLGSGVMLYLHDGGRIDIGGNASMILTPPLSGTYQGVCVFQARGNASVCSIQGNGTYDVLGTMYHPAGGLDFGGGPGRTVGRIITWTMSMNGNGSYLITGQGFLPPPGPEYVFLVE